MLMAHPTVLRNLVEQYEALALLSAGEEVTETRQRLEDVSYTLCVTTGVKDPEAALLAARERLSGTFRESDPRRWRDGPFGRPAAATWCGWPPCRPDTSTCGTAPTRTGRTGSYASPTRGPTGRRAPPALVAAGDARPGLGGRAPRGVRRLPPPLRLRRPGARRARRPRRRPAPPRQAARLHRARPAQPAPGRSGTPPGGPGRAGPGGRPADHAHPGAAAEIAARWNRTATVLPHPHVVEPALVTRPARTGRASGSGCTPRACGPTWPYCRWCASWPRPSPDWTARNWP